MQATSEYLTPKEVASILRISTDSAIRIFGNYKGVLNLGTEEGRFKRRYRTLRIPREALQRFIVENRIQ